MAALSLLVLTVAACGSGESSDVATDVATEEDSTTAQEGTPASSGSDTLKIGALIPLTGPFGPLGQEQRRGLELYLDQQGGELGGHPVEIVFEDSEGDPEVGVRRARSLLEEEEVHVGFGIVSSAVALGIRDAFHEAEVPFIHTNASANAITGEAASPYMIRTSNSSSQQGIAPGRWLSENRPDDTVFALASDYAGGREINAAFRDEFSGEIVDERFAPFGTQDWEPYISALRASGASVAFVNLAGEEGLRFMQQFLSFGMTDEVEFLGIGSVLDSSLLPEFGEEVVGLRTTYPWADGLPNPENEAFLEAYSEAHPGEDPSYQTVASFDAAHLLDLAVQSMQGDDFADGASLAQAISEAPAFDGPRGPFQLDENRNPVTHWYLREVVQNEDGSLSQSVVEDLGLIEQ